MMQDESAEIQVQATMAKNVVISAASSIFSDSVESEEGPADEFRPVRISIVTTNPETRDEAIEHDVRMDVGDDERATEEENNGREEVKEIVFTEMRDVAPLEEENIEVSFSPTAPFDDLKQHDVEIQSVVSALGKSQDNQETTTSSLPRLEPEGEKSDAPELEEEMELEEPEEQVITVAISSQSLSVALFDASLLDDASNNDDAVDEDDLSVVSKNVVDESSKNVQEAEAHATEMQRQLAESLAAFSNSVDEQEVSDKSESELPSSGSSDSADSFYSKNKILKLVNSSEGAAEVSNHRTDLRTVGSALDSASVSSASSAKGTVPLRRPRPTFRHRRPSTSSWTSTDQASDSAIAPKIKQFFKSLPLTQNHQQLLENVVVPAVFLVVAVAICRTFFHPWLKVGNDQSSTWALTWTILCIAAVVAPVCALEYMLLGGLLAGTVVEEALVKYPEVKKFLKDVRRMRLKAGWWYPSEVRALRKDLEATNAEILVQQMESMKSEKFDSEEDADNRSIQRQMSREDHRREKVQLENVFESERAEWYTIKEELMAEALSASDQSAKLQDQLQTEQQKQKQLATQKEQLENNIEVERAQWKFSRVSLEDALKTAVAAQADNEQTKDFFAKMEQARDEERNLWEKERQGFQATIHQSEKDANLVHQEHEEKVRHLDEMRASKQSQWDAERNSLKDAVKNAVNDAKAVKDTLESHICQMMDANDEKNDREIRDLKVQSMTQKIALEQMLEEAKGQQRVSLQCVSNLQSVLEEEKTERETLDQKLKQTETVLEEERASWEAARKTFEDALVVAANSSATTQPETCVTTSLRQDLKTKESKIKALEVSIQQLENIVSIQETIEVSSSSQKNKRNKNHRNNNSKADREASPVAYVISQDGASVHSSSRCSMELSSSSSSSLQGDNGTVASEASSYYSWVEKVQETHGKEQRQLLKGLLTQHVRWQAANHHVKQLLDSSRVLLEASETFESSETFEECLVKHTATSESAKKYMDELATKKSPELPRFLVAKALAAKSSGTTTTTTTSPPAEESSSRSSTKWIVKLANPWLKNAPQWEQIWAKTINININNNSSPKDVAKTVCSGIFVGAGVGLGLFHLRGMKQQKLSR